jgi:hypothetical protein
MRREGRELPSKTRRVKSTERPKEKNKRRVKPQNDQIKKNRVGLKVLGIKKMQSLRWERETISEILKTPKGKDSTVNAFYNWAEVQAVK